MYVNMLLKLFFNFSFFPISFPTTYMLVLPSFIILLTADTQLTINIVIYLCLYYYLSFLQLYSFSYRSCHCNFYVNHEQEVPIQFLLWDLLLYTSICKTFL